MTRPVFRLLSAVTLALITNVAILAADVSTRARSHEALEHRTERAMRRTPTIYVITYRPGRAYRRDRPLLRQELREHGNYIKAHVDAGVVIAAGPTFEQPGGLVLITAKTQEDALAFIRNDPAVVAGVFVGLATDWRPIFDARDVFRRPSE
jgi:uncharacterized protein YciI